ncbi:Apc13p [Cinara cedri]|uniref:Apc13p n=1 Tax=Cinara cedri TaxID=506608 RepID=A0A5E4MAS8_9HEMI|nr:Apc13p [Cinara cedri]
MDSNPAVNARLQKLIDDPWREENLSFDEIVVPIKELPDPEADATEAHLTLTQQDTKWTDLALSKILIDNPLPPPPRC